MSLVAPPGFGMAAADQKAQVLALMLVYNDAKPNLRSRMATRRQLILTTVLAATKAPLSRAEPAAADGEVWSIRAMLSGSLKD